MYWANEEKTAIIVNDNGARLVYEGTEEFNSIDKTQVKFYEPSPEQVKQNRIQQIQAELLTIDQKRIRPIAEGDTEYLAVLNTQVVTLREELRGLNA